MVFKATTGAYEHIILLFQFQINKKETRQIFEFKMNF